MPHNQRLDDPAVQKEDDAFNRWPFSKRLADTIAEFDASEGAPVIGIYGKWGSGKTSVLNFLNSALKENHADKVVLHPFNPWLFKDHETLLDRFFAELFKAMQKSGKGFAERIGGMLQEYSGLFGLFPGFSAGSKVAEQAGKALSKSIEEVRDEVRKMMQTAEKKVVVLIDDLDRLDRDEVLQMLKVVRLTANFPNVVYLLAFDDEMVGRAIAQKYGSDADAGRQFLEKIVQYPYSLPAVSRERLMNFVEQQTKSACEHAEVILSDEDWQVFRNLAHGGLARRLTTPRQAIRYGNALRFALPMMKGEVNALDQLGIEGLRVLYPELYTVVRDNKEIFSAPSEPEDYPTFNERTAYIDNLRVNKRAVAERIALATRGMAEDEAASARNLIDFLFDRAEQAAQGVVRARYFDRYFSYGIADDQIGDVEVDSLVSDSDDRSALLLSLLRRNADLLLELLAMRIPRLDTGTTIRLAQLLIGSSKSMQSIDGIDLRHVAFVTAHLILRVADLQSLLNQRQIAIRDARALPGLLEMAGRDLEPLALALSFHDELYRADLKRKHAEPRDYVSPVNESAWKSLSNILAERLARRAGTVDWTIMVESPAEAISLLTEWNKHDAPAQRRWLGQILHGHPEAVAPFLRLCVGESTPLSISVNQGAIKSLVELREFAEAARVASASATNAGDKEMLATFFEWYDTQQPPQ